jgi:DegV family protein with EDD domain
MSIPQNQLRELTGHQLYASFMAGAKRIFEHQALLNRINVFPVPDADTGINLASTMRSIVDANIPVDNLKQTAVAIADAALSGARGNSGIIFAQFLYGFSEELKAEAKLDVKAFAESMKNAVKYAYEAIANPVEGTILTVIKEWAEYMYLLKDILDDFIRLLIEAYHKAVESLSETTRKLEILARTHVVDAGAKGFVFFLEGILDFFMKGDAGSEIIAEEQEESGPMPDLHEEITFRYCTEAMLSAEFISKPDVQKALTERGDSLVIAGSTKKMRIHLHTDHPAEVMSLLSRFGNITYQKVDDMVFQHEILHNPKSDIALLTDSTCDLPQEILDRHQIHVLPLIVQFGESFYLDRLTMNPPQFYERVRQSAVQPTTSQPSVKDFQNKYEYLHSQYRSVIGFFISEKLSGTYQNGVKSAVTLGEKVQSAFRIFDSRNVSAAMGLTVLRAARALEAGSSLEEVLRHIPVWIDKCHLRVSVPTMRYIIRSGRVSPLRGFIARALDLKPVIALNREGKAELFGKALSHKGSQKKLIHGIGQFLKGREVWEYAITHAGNPEVAASYAEEMEKITSKKPLFIGHISPVLVTHTGPGVVGVSFMLN